MGASCSGGEKKGKLAWQVESAIDANDEGRLRKLLQGGATPEGVRDKGGNALHRCIHGAQVRLVGLLLQYGADIHFQDCHGRRPLDIANIRSTTQRSQARMEIILLLKAEETKATRQQLQHKLRHGEVGTTVMLSQLKDSTPCGSADEAPVNLSSGSEGAEHVVRATDDHKEESDFTDKFDKAQALRVGEGNFEALDECIVCHDRVPQVTIMPCKHECLCKSCSLKMVGLYLQGLKSVQSCPICRVPLKALMVTRQDLELPSSEVI